MVDGIDDGTVDLVDFNDNDALMDMVSAFDETTDQVGIVDGSMEVVPLVPLDDSKDCSNCSSIILVIINDGNPITDDCSSLDIVYVVIHHSRSI